MFYFILIMIISGLLLFSGTPYTGLNGIQFTMPNMTTTDINTGTSGILSINNHDHYYNCSCNILYQGNQLQCNSTLSELATNACPCVADPNIDAEDCSPDINAANFNRNCAVCKNNSTRYCIECPTDLTNPKYDENCFDQTECSFDSDKTNYSPNCKICSDNTNKLCLDCPSDVNDPNYDFACFDTKKCSPRQEDSNYNKNCKICPKDKNRYCLVCPTDINDPNYDPECVDSGSGASCPQLPAVVGSGSVQTAPCTTSLGKCCKFQNAGKPVFCGPKVTKNCCSSSDNGATKQDIVFSCCATDSKKNPIYPCCRANDNGCKTPYKADGQWK